MIPSTARRGISLARAAGEGDFFPTLFPCLGTATWVLGQLLRFTPFEDEEPV
jgi:hypothetical protein